MNSRDILTIPHPLYSSELFLYNSWLFLKVKFPLKGRKFNTNNEGNKAVEIEKNCSVLIFKKWKERLEKCIRSEGGYYEKEYVDLID